MGTRADFYTGKGRDANWLGSVGMDGHPETISEQLSLTLEFQSIASEADWTESVAAVFDAHEEHTLPEMGWPWPWDDSNTTDYAYTYEAGKVWVSCFGRLWVTLQWALEEEDAWDAMEGGQLDFPDMSAIKNIRYDSGNAPMIFGVKADGSLGMVNDEVVAKDKAQKEGRS